MRVSLIIIFLSIVFSSCAKNNDKNFKDARSSFVKIEIKENVSICYDGSCNQRSFVAVSSGVVVKFKNSEKVVLTAAHSCKMREDNEIPKIPGATIKIESEVNGYDINNMKHVLKIKKRDIEEDLCILEADTLWQDGVPVSKIHPKADQRVYNYASPKGIFEEGMIPLFEGFYSGIRGSYAGYTIPAALGSSGSMIIDRKGYLIGMIHSVHAEFNHFAMSPTLCAIRKFLELDEENKDD